MLSGCRSTLAQLGDDFDGPSDQLFKFSETSRPSFGRGLDRDLICAERFFSMA
jgi:hypothetical protein